jgi:hypothetical protein
MKPKSDDIKKTSCDDCKIIKICKFHPSLNLFLCETCWDNTQRLMKGGKIKNGR